MRRPSSTLFGQLALSSLACALGGCADVDRQPHVEPSLQWTYDPDLIPDQLALSVRNKSDVAICIPTATELTLENLTLSQGGVGLDPVAGNRKVLEWRAADLADGMTVLPPGKSIDVFFDLSRWPLAAGPTKVDLSVRWISCESFFAEENSSFDQVGATFAFSR